MCLDHERKQNCPSERHEDVWQTEGISPFILNLDAMDRLSKPMITCPSAARLLPTISEQCESIPSTVHVRDRISTASGVLTGKCLTLTFPCKQRRKA